MLPNPVRYATLATLALGAIVSFGGLQGIGRALTVAEMDVSAGETPFLNKLTPNPEAFAAAQRAQAVAFRNSVENMRWPRVAVLFGLSAAASLVFVSALRLRWPSGVQRSNLAKLVSRAAIAAAVLRTLDGAQELVIVRAVANAWDKTLAQHQVEAADAGVTTGVLSAASVGTTVVVTGLFVLAANYFRSERIQQTFVLLDRNTPEEE